MHSIVSAFTPIWAIVLVGWAARRAGLVTGAARDALTGFAFTIAMPALLFTTLTGVTVHDIDARMLAAFAVSTLAAGSLAMAASRWVARDPLPDQVVAALAAGYVNSGNLGIPVAATVLGDITGLVLVTAYQLMVVTPVALFVLGAPAGRPGATGSFGTPLKNPIILASAAGLAVAATGLHPPEAMLKPLRMLGQAAVPVALFALGTALNESGGRTGRGHYVQVGALTALKIVVQPLAAFLAGRYAFGLDPGRLSAVVLFAGLPTAQNIFVYADRYRRPTGLCRDVILASTLLSMVSLLVITVLVPPP